MFPIISWAQDIKDNQNNQSFISEHIKTTSVSYHNSD